MYQVWSLAFFSIAILVSPHRLLHYVKGAILTSCCLLSKAWFRNILGFVSFALNSGDWVFRLLRLNNLTDTHPSIISGSKDVAHC